MTTIRMRLTESDLLTAMRTHYIRTLRRPLVVWSGVVLAAIVAFKLITTPWSELTRSVGGLGTLGVIVLFGLLPLTYFVLIPRAARKTLAQQKNLQGDMEMAWDDARIVSRGPYGVTDFAWSDYRAWFERDGMVLLYQTDLMFQFAPARAFPSDAVRAEMIAHLEAAGVPRADRRRGTPKPA